jgi:hypothetical protein
VRRRQKANGKKKATARTKLRLPDLDHARAGVLNSLRSPESQCSYRHAIDEFISWYGSEPRCLSTKQLSLDTGFILNLAFWHPERLMAASRLYADSPMSRRCGSTKSRTCGQHSEG